MGHSYIKLPEDTLNKKAISPLENDETPRGDGDPSLYGGQVFKIPQLWVLVGFGFYIAFTNQNQH